MDRAIASLVEVTFVSERTEQRTARLFTRLFQSRLPLREMNWSKMGELETHARLPASGIPKQDATCHRGDKPVFRTCLPIRMHRQTFQKRAIILSRIAEGQARSLGYQAANQYYKQALELEPRSVYTLVSYGLFKMELGNYGEAIALINQATQYCTKKTGYYVYYSLSGYMIRLVTDRIELGVLGRALDYEPKRTIAQHSLGVAQSQSGNFDEALDIFNGIIREELSRSDGPSESLVYAYRTKIITLQHAQPQRGKPNWFFRKRSGS